MKISVASWEMSGALGRGVRFIRVGLRLGGATAGHAAACGSLAPYDLGASHACTPWYQRAKIGTALQITEHDDSISAVYTKAVEIWAHATTSSEVSI